MYCLASKKLPQVTVSRVVQEFCESDHAFGNAILFSSGLDFGQISVARPLRRSGHGACYVAG